MSPAMVTDPAVLFVYAGNAITCASCGVVFWMTSAHEALRREDGKSFYCPNGHSLSFKDSEATRYKRLYQQAEDRAAAARAERDQAEAGRRAWKGQATKLRKRVVAGECPFCGQHLRDLERHVTRQHADESAVGEGPL